MFREDDFYRFRQGKGIVRTDMTEYGKFAS